MDGTDLDSTGYTAYTSGGTAAKVYEVVTPYVEADLSTLKFTQSGDIITITHNKYQQRELARSGHTTWTLSVVVFQATIGVPTSLLSSSPGSGHTYKVTAVDAETSEESLPSTLEEASTAATTLTWTAVSGAGHYNIYKLQDGAYGWIGLAGGVASPSFKTETTYTPDVLDNPPVDRQPFEVVITDATQADPCVLTVVAHGIASNTLVTVHDVTGMTELNDIQYLMTSLTDDTISLQTTAGVDVDSSAFTAYSSAGVVGTYPAVCTYFQQRKMFANTTADIEGVWSSKSTLRKNFMKSTPLQDDDPVTFSMLGKEVNAIKHLLDLGSLFILTTSGEWIVEGDTAGILIPSAINPRQHSYNGSNDLEPLVINDTALYVQGHGSAVRELGYNAGERSQTTGVDLSVFASNLFDKFTIADWAYQKIPNSTVWCARSDGRLLGLTYIKEHEVTAWHNHTFQSGSVKSVCVVPEGSEDVLYMTVERTINGRTVKYIEYMKTRLVTDIVDAVFMDSSLSLDGRNTSATTMTLSGGSTWKYDEDLTLTASASFFTSNDATSSHAIWMKTATTVVRCTITGYTSPTVVTIRPHKTVPAALQDTAITLWEHAVLSVGGLWHLEGEDVAIFSDGYVSASPNNDAYGIKTVSNGTITLDDPHSVVHIGLTITADLETLKYNNPDSSSVAGKSKQIGDIVIHFEASRGGFFGFRDNLNELIELKIRQNENYDTPIQLTTGEQTVDIVSKWNKSGQVLIRQIDPLPITVLAVTSSGFLPR
jgi:hypothetical protein